MEVTLLRGTDKSLFCKHSIGQECPCGTDEFWLLREKANNGLQPMRTQNEKFATVIRMFLHEHTEKIVKLLDSSNPQTGLFLTKLCTALGDDMENLRGQIRLNKGDATPGLPLSHSLKLVSELEAELKEL